MSKLEKGRKGARIQKEAHGCWADHRESSQVKEQRGTGKLNHFGFDLRASWWQNK